MRSTRTYTEEFRSEAIQLAIQSGNISNTAKQLVIPQGTLHTWVKNASKDNITLVTTPSKKVSVGDLMDEIKQLKKALSRAEQEKAILKKATAYFAREQS